MQNEPILHFTKEQFDALPHHGVYDGDVKHARGRRTTIHPTRGYMIFEGVDFLVDDDPSHLPVLTKANARAGAYYLVDEKAVAVHRVRHLGPTETKLINAEFLDVVETTVGTFALEDADRNPDYVPKGDEEPAFGRWTDANERTPETEGPVIVAYRDADGDARTDAYACRRWGTWVWWTGDLADSEDFVEDEDCVVTHWMPAPPKP